MEKFREKKMIIDIYQPLVWENNCTTLVVVKKPTAAAEFKISIYWMNGDQLLYKYIEIY